MNTQRNNIVRSILLIAIGMIVGIVIVIGIGRIRNAPSWVSQRVGQSDRQVAVYDRSRHALSFKVLVGRADHVGRLDAATVGRAAAEVVRVRSDVHDNSLLA